MPDVEFIVSNGGHRKREVELDQNLGKTDSDRDPLQTSHGMLSRLGSDRQSPEWPNL